MATIEELLVELTKAVKANTAAIAAGKPANSTANAGKPANSTANAGTTAAKASKYTVDQVKAIAVRVRDEVDPEKASALIKKHGGGKLAELVEKKTAWDKFVADAEKTIADHENSADETSTDEPDETGDL